MLIGAIADDLTGATDIALAFSREGLRVIQFNGVPDEAFNVPDVDAVVIALKSRTIPADEAVSLSRRAAAWLSGRKAKQIVFKYCSTFDSTDAGNIGPVIEALMSDLREPLTVACPTFPENGRTVFQGHLFVGQQLLAESSMRDHPLTPMKDSNLVRVLQRQTTVRVGLLATEVVRGVPGAIRAKMDDAIREGLGILVADAATQHDLDAIAMGCRGRVLITGAAGIGGALARTHCAMDKVKQKTSVWPSGRTAILAGSCSQATRSQLQYAAGQGYPALKVSPADIASGKLRVEDVTRWAAGQIGRPPMVYASAEPSEVLAAQRDMGAELVSKLIEDFLGSTAAMLCLAGFRRFIVAGGETSGAVSNALNVSALEIGPEIDPGIPWTKSIGGVEVALALKSGNFGTVDFFEKAMAGFP